MKGEIPAVVHPPTPAIDASNMERKAWHRAVAQANQEHAEKWKDGGPILMNTVLERDLIEILLVCRIPSLFSWRYRGSVIEPARTTGSSRSSDLSRIETHLPTGADVRTSRTVTIVTEGDPTTMTQASIMITIHLTNFVPKHRSNARTVGATKLPPSARTPNVTNAERYSSRQRNDRSVGTRLTAPPGQTDLPRRGTRRRLTVTATAAARTAIFGNFRGNSEAPKGQREQRQERPQ